MAYFKKVTVISKADIEKQYQEILLLEQDYELATLFQAMQQQDLAQIEKSKARLAWIHDELYGLELYT